MFSRPIEFSSLIRQNEPFSIDLLSVPSAVPCFSRASLSFMTDSEPSGQRPQPKFQVAIVPVTPLQQNSSIIWSTDTMEAAVVDPGGDAERIAAAVEELQVKVTAVWLTHGHVDHAGAAGRIKRDFDVPIIGPHEKDQFLLDEIETSCLNYGISGGMNVTPDRYLHEGDKVELAEIQFDV